MPADRPVRPVALANDRFRRAVGKDAVVNGRVMFEGGLDQLPTRVRVAIIAAVRAYAFSAEDGDQYAARRTATIIVQGVAYRFAVEAHAHDERAPRVLRIGPA
jgi:hypothetical protein